ncbi:MAG TPA: MFS transporter [Gaiellaceae bacterium]|jgi:EmrB/QacA subfamily drug resistance transporter|nr:MFS transporter [Gaiellaceae bacterium]
MDHPERSHPNVTLAVLSVAGLAFSMLSSAVVPALPTIQHSLHTTESGVAWVLTAYLLSASVGTAIIGRLGDMYGKEHVLVWTLVVLSAGTLLAGVSGSLSLLIVARAIQGAGGGVFPLAFGIIRDEFPREKIAGSIGLMSGILGVGGGVGIIVGAVIVEHLSWHWLFWLPLVVLLVSTVATWRFVPESPVRVAGRVNWLAAILMSAGMTLVLVAVSETTYWGWGSAKTVLVLLAGAVGCVLWVLVEVRSEQPLIDMTLMRVRAVWTANLAAFLLGAGMYASFIVFPQFAQLPKSTGFGYGASVLVSALYLLPSTVGMVVVGFAAGWIAVRFGSKAALVGGSIVTALSFGVLAVQHAHPYDMLVSSALLGIGIGLAFAALGNIVVQAVADHQTGVASGMNTVMRSVGGALGGQLIATFLADHVRDGLPTVTGFTEGFWMSTGFLVVCALAALLVPGRHSSAYVAHFEDVAVAD